MKDLIILNPPSMSIEQVEELPLYAFINCAGSTAATAAVFNYPTDGRFIKVRLTATFVDASNFGVLLTNSFAVPGTNLVPIEYEVFANGPNGDSVTAYLSAGAFVDGTTSVSIPCGKGKIITPVAGNSVTPVWGEIG